MRSHIYRGFEINCAVTKAETGKPSARWHCTLTIRALDQPEPLHYEIDLNAWTPAGARSLCIQYAKQHVDESTGPEHYPGQAAHPSCSPLRKKGGQH
jgi:hypothetical protein